MDKKTILMLVLFVALLGGVIGVKVALRPPGVREGGRPRPIPAFKAADVDGLEVSYNKATTVMKKSGETWSLTAPVAYAADASATKAALEKLESLTFEGIATTRPEKQADYEVTEDKGIHVVARKGDAVLADFYLGKVAGGVTMLRVAGKNDVWRASGALKYVFGKEPKNWRNHEVMTFKRDEVEKIELTTPAGTVACTRTAGGTGKPDTWALATAPAGVAIEKLDDSVPAGILSTMMSLRAFDFADGVKPEETGLATPAATATAYLKGGAKKQVLVGKAKGDQYYVKVPDGEQVYLISKYSVERILKKPIDFRDKTVVDVKPDQIVGLAIDVGGEKTALTRSGEEWTATAPAGLTVDSNKVKTLIGGFGPLKAYGFADEQTSKKGFAKPAGSVVLKLKDKRTVTLKFGELEDQEYPVRKVGSPDTYIFKKYAADRFLKKPDDLKKTAGAAMPHRMPKPPVRVTPRPAPAKAR